MRVFRKAYPDWAFAERLALQAIVRHAAAHPARKRMRGQYLPCGASKYSRVVLTRVPPLGRFCLDSATLPIPKKLVFEPNYAG